MEAAVTTKGQIVIPAKLRQRLGIKKGTRLHVEERDGDIILRTLNREYFQKMSGILKGGGLVKALEKSRAEDRKRERTKVSVAKVLDSWALLCYLEQEPGFETNYPGL